MNFEERLHGVGPFFFCGVGVTEMTGCGRGCDRDGRGGGEKWIWHEVCPEGGAIQNLNSNVS